MSTQEEVEIIFVKGNSAELKSGARKALSDWFYKSSTLEWSKYVTTLTSCVCELLTDEKLEAKVCEWCVNTLKARKRGYDVYYDNIEALKKMVSPDVFNKALLNTCTRFE